MQQNRDLRALADEVAAAAASQVAKFSPTHDVGSRVAEPIKQQSAPTGDRTTLRGLETSLLTMALLLVAAISMASLA